MPRASFMAATLSGEIQYTARKYACAGGGYTVCHVEWLRFGEMLASRSPASSGAAGGYAYGSSPALATRASQTYRYASVESVGEVGRRIRRATIPIARIIATLRRLRR